MNRNKRVFAVILSLIMAASLVVPVFAIDEWDSPSLSEEYSILFDSDISDEYNISPIPFLADACDGVEVLCLQSIDIASLNLENYGPVFEFDFTDGNECLARMARSNSQSGTTTLFFSNSNIHVNFTYTITYCRYQWTVFGATARINFHGVSANGSYLYLAPDRTRATALWHPDNSTITFRIDVDARLRSNNQWVGRSGTTSRTVRFHGMRSECDI